MPAMDDLERVAGLAEDDDRPALAGTTAGAAGLGLKRRAGLALALSCTWLPLRAVAQPARAMRIGLLLPRQQQFRVPDLLERLRAEGHDIDVAVRRAISVPDAL